MKRKISAMKGVETEKNRIEKIYKKMILSRNKKRVSNEVITAEKPKKQELGEMYLKEKFQFIPSRK